MTVSKSEPKPKRQRRPKPKKVRLLMEPTLLEKVEVYRMRLADRSLKRAPTLDDTVSTLLENALKQLPDDTDGKMMVGVMDAMHGGTVPVFYSDHTIYVHPNHPNKSRVEYGIKRAEWLAPGAVEINLTGGPSLRVHPRAGNVIVISPET